MYPDLPPVTKRIIILGYQDSLVVNHIILVGKRMITQNYNLSLDTVFIRILMDKKTELDFVNVENQERAFNAKWQAVEKLIDRGWPENQDSIADER